MLRIPVSELPTGTQRRVTVDEEPVLLINHEGELHAVSYYCSHMEFPLEGGTIEEGMLVCPYHGAGFCLRTGEPDGPPAMNPIEIYSVSQDNGQLLIMRRPKGS